MVRLLLMSSVSFLTKFNNLKRPIDDACMIKQSKSWILHMWSSTSIIVPSHSVSSALMLLLLQFHNQGVRMLMPMSFNLMCTPINLLLCFQGNRMIRAAKTGNVEEVRKCLDSGTNVNYSNVIIFYMIIDVFA